MMPSALTYNMLTVGSTIRLGKKKYTHTATKLIGPLTARISDHVSKAQTRKAHTITQEPEHPLQQYFSLLLLSVLSTGFHVCWIVMRSTVCVPSVCTKLKISSVSTLYIEHYIPASDVGVPFKIEIILFTVSSTVKVATCPSHRTLCILPQNVRTVVLWQVD